MPKKFKVKGLFIACALQFDLISSVFILAYLPIVFGTEVKVIAKGYNTTTALFL